MTELNSSSTMDADYVNVDRIGEDIRTNPKSITMENIRMVAGYLDKTDHERRTKSFFLYRKAAKILAAVLVLLKDRQNIVFQEAYQILAGKLKDASEKKRQAASIALGNLPFQAMNSYMDFPELLSDDDLKGLTLPLLTAEMLSDKAGVRITGNPALLGRTLVFPTSRGKMVMAVKIARKGDLIKNLNSEAVWMRKLSGYFEHSHAAFHIPEPIAEWHGAPCYLFRAANMTKYMGNKKKGGLHPQLLSIAFLAHENYYQYPNDHETLSNKDCFFDMMSDLSFLFGNLSAKGIVHTAPIPLFHNRVQQNRREDLGIYDWQLGGRLDRWLSSCVHPNFGPSGLRDFEHFEVMSGKTSEVYRHIGNQLLSLVLVSGSYFRNHAPDLVGLDAKGNPVDARLLFDRDFFKDLIQTIFHSFHKGFTGYAFTGDFPMDFSHFSERLINEMGVDRHMAEIIRVRDQDELTHHEFTALLKSHGFSEARIKETPKGKNDITVYTGPHLGEFNGRISLPELIRFLEASASLSVSNHFLMQC